MDRQEAAMDDEQQTPRARAMRPVMTRLPLEIWQELDAIAQGEGSTVAAVLRRLTKERLEQRRVSAAQDPQTAMRECAGTPVAQPVSETSTMRDQRVDTPHRAWYEDTLRAIGHELDRRAVDRVTIVEREQSVLVCGHQPTEGHGANEDGRFEWVLTAEDLMALLDAAYDRRSRQWVAHRARRATA